MIHSYSFPIAISVYGIIMYSYITISVYNLYMCISIVHIIIASRSTYINYNIINTLSNKWFSSYTTNIPLYVVVYCIFSFYNWITIGNISELVVHKAKTDNNSCCFCSEDSITKTSKYKTIIYHFYSFNIWPSPLRSYPKGNTLKWVIWWNSRTFS